MADRPLLFSGSMIRALIDGRKTQTRRALKSPYGTLELTSNGWKPVHTKVFTGDRLWVRETLKADSNDQGHRWITYAADGSVTPHGLVMWDWKRDSIPSIHMPRWASRLTLTVTDVRVERLQDISEADAVAEGCFKGKASGRVFANETAMHLGGDEWSSARDWYADLWETINGPEAWNANPWVVAYTFTVDKRNIDQIARAA